MPLPEELEQEEEQQEVAPEPAPEPEAVPQRSRYLTPKAKMNRIKANINAGVQGKAHSAAQSWESRRNQAQQDVARDKFGNEAPGNILEKFRDYGGKKGNLGAMAMQAGPKDAKQEIAEELKNAESDRVSSNANNSFIKSPHGSNEKARVARESQTRDDIKRMIADGVSREEAEKYAKDAEIGKIQPGSYKKGKRTSYIDQHLKNQRELEGVLNLDKGIKSRIPKHTSAMAKMMMRWRQ
jgi:hypothetical protein